MGNWYIAAMIRLALPTGTHADAFAQHAEKAASATSAAAAQAAGVGRVDDGAGRPGDQSSPD